MRGKWIIRSPPLNTNIEQQGWIPSLFGNGEKLFQQGLKIQKHGFKKKNHEDKLEIIFVIYITDKGLKVLIYKKLVKVEKTNFYERNGQEIQAVHKKIQMVLKHMKRMLNLIHIGRCKLNCHWDPSLSFRSTKIQEFENTLYWWHWETGTC